jgi:outer membrane protein assembly factor BamB
MKYQKIAIVILLAFTALILAGCTGAGGGVNNWPGMTVTGDVAYLADGASIYGIDLTNGTQKWVFPERQQSGGIIESLFNRGPNYGILFAPPAIDGEMMVIGNYTKELFGINITNSTEMWKFTDADDRYIGGALIASDYVFAPNADGNLYILKKNGQLVKTITTTGPLWSTPVLNGTVVYLSGLDHNLHAYDLKSLDQLWQTDLGGALVASPVLDADGNLLVGNISGLLSKVDGKTGKILDQTTLSGGIWSKPVINDGKVYIGVQSGDFYALDEKKLSQKPILINTSSSVIASPVLVPDGVVYVNEGGNVANLKTDLTENWHQKLTGQLYSDPVLVGDLILVPVKGGDVLLQSIKTNGALSWPFKPGK